MIIDSSSSKQSANWNTLQNLAAAGKIQYLKTNQGDNSVNARTFQPD